MQGAVSAIMKFCAIAIWAESRLFPNFTVPNVVTVNARFTLGYEVLLGRFGRTVGSYTQNSIFRY